MSATTGIEWTDATWNPIRGCSLVSEGCRHCYAMKVAARFDRTAGVSPAFGTGTGGRDARGTKPLPYDGLTRDGKWNGTVKLVEEHLADPLKWKKPRKIFVNSMSDLFHEAVPDEWIDRIFAVMALAPQHTFQVLTKRPERMLKYMTGGLGDGATGRIEAAAARLVGLDDWLEARDVTALETWPPLPNVWLGVSVEDQKAADARIPLLLQTPAAVRFLSCEPLLGPVDLCAIDNKHGETFDCLKARVTRPSGHEFQTSDTKPIDWVIVGGESGQGARPMHPAWARTIRDQCAGSGAAVGAGVPFFFKQWGEWAPFFHVRDELKLDLPKARLGAYGSWMADDAGGFAKELLHCDGVPMVRVGKTRAGRQLDGRTHDEFPQTKGVNA